MDQRAFAGLSENAWDDRHMKTKNITSSDPVAMLKAMVDQAKEGKAGLVLVSVATAEEIIRRLETAPEPKKDTKPKKQILMEQPTEKVVEQE